MRACVCVRVCVNGAAPFSFFPYASFLQLLPFQPTLNSHHHSPPTHKTYASYDASLGVLIEQQRLEEYPNLVAETTSVFAVLSARIRSIRGILLERGGAVEGEAAAAISLLQSAEKDKLMLVAAAHLDKLGRGGAVAGVLGGMTLLAEGEGGYTSKRLLEVEAAIQGCVGAHAPEAWDFVTDSTLRVITC